MTENSTTEMPKPDETTKSTRSIAGLVAMALLAVIVMAIGGMFFMHYSGRDAALKTPEKAAAFLQERGFEFSFGEVEIGGAPARMNIFIYSPRIVHLASGFGWSTDLLESTRYVYSSKRLNLIAPGAQVVVTPLGEIKLDAHIRGGVSLIDTEIDAVSLSTADATFESGVNTGTISLLELHLGPPETLPLGFKHWPRRTYLRLDALSLGGGARVSAVLNGTTLFEDAPRTDAPPPRVLDVYLSEGRILLTAVSGQQVRLDVQGDLSFNTDQPFGKFTVETNNGPLALDILEKAGVLSEESTAALRARVAESGRLVGVLEVAQGRLQMLDLGPDPIPLTRPE